MLCILITLVIAFGQWLIYTALLWGMIKVQRLNYNLLGLLGSSLLATALGYIPVVGTYIGWAALVICLWKCTGADIAPDVLFTVGVAGALMFCVNLFAIAWLMGNLHLVSPALAEAYGDNEDEIGMALEFEDEMDGPEPVRVTVIPSVPTNAAAAPRPTKTISAARPPAVQLTIKGVSLGASQKSALIGDGKQIRDVRPGEMFMVDSEKGRVTIVCEEITARAVKLTANGAPLTLTVH
jgi:hypothetical protein